MRPPSMRSWPSLLLLGACLKQSPIPGDDTDTSLPAALEAVDCVNAPAVTWEGWAEGMMRTHCQGCHASTTPNRYGAPEDVTFDTEDDARRYRNRIYQRTLVDEDMPPAGGLSEDDKTLLTVYLACGL